MSKQQKWVNKLINLFLDEKKITFGLRTIFGVRRVLWFIFLIHSD